MFKSLCVFALVATAASAWGQAAPSVADRIAVRKAQVELLKADKELLGALQDQAGASAGALPYVHAVMGLDGAMTARLMHASGIVSNYKVGDRVRPGMSVASITSREVWVSVGAGKQARSVPLEFRSARTAEEPVMPGGGPGLPGGRPPVPAELLPAPPAVQLPAVQTAAPPTPAPAPAAAAPAAAPAVAQAPTAPALKR